MIIVIKTDKRSAARREGLAWLDFEHDRGAGFSLAEPLINQFAFSLSLSYIFIFTFNDLSFFSMYKICLVSEF